jgi:hypothetical protein
MRNLLTLHEAVAVILLSESDRTSTFQNIASKIEKRNLFPDRKGGITLEKQIKLRTAISSSKYKNWFDYVKPETIKLK